MTFSACIHIQERLAVIKIPPPINLQKISAFQYVRCDLPNVSNHFFPRSTYISDLTPNGPPHSLLLDHTNANCPSALPAQLASYEDAGTSLPTDAQIQIAAEDDSSCIVCWDQPRDAVLLECGHGGLCVACADLLWRQTRRCPLCREEFAGVMRIVDASDATVRI